MTDNLAYQLQIKQTALEIAERNLSVNLKSRPHELVKYAKTVEEYLKKV
jgi:hypothetical protein